MQIADKLQIVNLEQLADALDLSSIEKRLETKDWLINSARLTDGRNVLTVQSNRDSAIIMPVGQAA